MKNIGKVFSFAIIAMIVVSLFATTNSFAAARVNTWIGTDFDATELAEDINSDGSCINKKLPSNTAHLDFMNPSNWSEGAPQNGDILKFTYAAPVKHTCTISSHDVARGGTRVATIDVIASNISIKNIPSSMSFGGLTITGDSSSKDNILPMLSEKLHLASGAIIDKATDASSSILGWLIYDGDIITNVSMGDSFANKLTLYGNATVSAGSKLKSLELRDKSGATITDKTTVPIKIANGWAGKFYVKNSSDSTFSSDPDKVVDIPNDIVLNADLPVITQSGITFNFSGKITKNGHKFYNDGKGELTFGAAKNAKSNNNQTPTGVIGISFNGVTKNGVIVRGLYANGSAENAGIVVGDIITKVNNKETAQMSADEFQQNLSGAIGSSVGITVKHGSKSHDYTLTRGDSSKVGSLLAYSTTGWVDGDITRSSAPVVIIIAIILLLIGSVVYFTKLRNIPLRRLRNRP